MSTGQEIICGETLTEVAKLPSRSFDAIVADPPYNLGKDYGNNHDLKGFEEYLAFSRAWLTQAHRLLKPTGTIFVFMGVRFISCLFDILDQELKMFFNSWITWHYTQGLGKTRGFSPRHEDILMFTKTEQFKFNLDAVRIPQKYYRERNNMDGANPGDVWQFSHVHYSNPEREEHPTQKPEALIERMVLVSTDEGDRVLDPFAGSGTTSRVCQVLRRHSLGIELNPQYVELIRNRLRKPISEFDSFDPRLHRTPKDLPQRPATTETQPCLLEGPLTFRKAAP
jgi:site-specific DNA-methyltransferase (adenine-specific)